MDKVLVCTGYIAGEVLPDEDNSPNLGQARILDYLKMSSLDKILIEEGVDIREHRDEISSAELIGAWHNICVYQAAFILLSNKVPVRINPSLTLGAYELAEHTPRNTELKTRWFENNLSGDGFYVRRDGEWLECWSG